MAYDDDVIAFIEARLDEDEATAKAAASVAGPDWWFDLADSYLKSPPGSFVADTMNAPGGDEAIGPFFARHDPARVLREVEAKRAILAEHGPADGGRDAGRCRVCTAITHTGMGHADARRFRAPCPTLLFLAAVYSDHPTTGRNGQSRPARPTGQPFQHGPRVLYLGQRPRLSRDAEQRPCQVRHLPLRIGRPARGVFLRPPEYPVRLGSVGGQFQAHGWLLM